MEAITKPSTKVPSFGNCQMICSVVNCHNTPTNTKKRGMKVFFYQMPNVAKWGIERKEAWIRFCQRKNLDGSDWVPSKHAKVCSVHFVDGEMKQHPHSPSFNPSIRANEVENESVLTQGEKKIARFERAKKRASVQKNAHPTAKDKKVKKSEELTELTTTIEESTFDLDESIFHQVEQDPLCDKLVQTEDNRRFSEKLVVFACYFVSTTEVATQVEYEEICEDSQTEEERGQSEIDDFHKKNPEISFELPIESKSLLNNASLLCLAGVDVERFHFLRRLIEDSLIQHSNTHDEKLLMSLMRVKLGISYSAIGVFFKVNRSTVQRTFIKVLQLIYDRTQPLIKWFSLEQIRSILPECFKSDFPNTRIIIDCTEVKTERPEKLKDRNLLYSSYKGTWTIKWFLGISPNGTITFLSQPYGGRTSDTYITNDCGILELLEPGDVVMGDKGFPKITVQDVVTVIPPRMNRSLNPQFSPEQLDLSYNISRLRIQVERSIQRVKMLDILNHKVPTELFIYMHQVMHLCCILTNLDKTIIKQ